MLVAATLAAIIATSLPIVAPLEPSPTVEPTPSPSVEPTPEPSPTPSIEPIPEPTPRTSTADIAVTTSSLVEFDADGAPRTLIYQIVNNGPDAANDVTSTISTPFEARSSSDSTCRIGSAGVSCDHGDLAPGQSVDMSIELAAPTTRMAAEITEQDINVHTATTDPDPFDNQVVYTVNVQKAPKTIREISGTASDQNGSPLANAQITLRDPTGVEALTTTDNRGLFVYQADPATPFREGKIHIKAQRKGYHVARTDIDANGPLFTGVSLTLKAQQVSKPEPTQKNNAEQALTPGEHLRKTGQGQWLVVKIGSALVFIAFVVSAVRLARNAKASSQH